MDHIKTALIVLGTIAIYAFGVYADLSGVFLR